MKKKINLFPVIVIALALFIRTTHCLAFGFVVGHSMEPTIANHQFTLGSSIANYQRGDIVGVKKDNGEILLKRVIGLPNETVKMKGGKIYIDGVLWEEDYIAEENNIKTSKSENDFVIKLGADEYFVLGDNRDNSADSRYYGPFKAERLLYKAYLY